MLLAVEGFRPAVVELPPDDGSCYPVVVAAHGAGDGPRYQCAFWRELLGERAIVLCPTGLPLGKSDEDGHYYKDHLELEREVLAAVSALRTEFADEIAPGPFVYVAYSQGATMGSLMLPPHGDVFQRLVLIEGGFEQWNVPIAKRFREAGGKRVLFACGTKGCNRGAERSAEWMKQAGLDARVEYVPGGGHTYGGAVGERMLSSLDWVLSGDPRFH